MEGMVGKQGEEEMAEILGKVYYYKVRPFVQVGNMRGLNPSGKPSSKRKRKTKTYSIVQTPTN